VGETSAAADTGPVSIQTVTGADSAGAISSDSGGTAAAKSAYLATANTAPPAGYTPTPAGGFALPSVTTGYSTGDTTDSGVTPDYTVSNKEMYSSGRTNMHGSYSSVSGKTDADVTSGWEEYADFKNSSSNAYWWGGSPINAAQMDASMTWKMSGLDVSVSVPAGVSFSRSGNAVIWGPPAVANTWHVGLSRSSSVHFATPFTFYSEYFYADADVLIGSTWYHVSGN
jgi:hypothetical protein